MAIIRYWPVRTQAQAGQYFPIHRIFALFISQQVDSEGADLLFCGKFSQFWQFTASHAEILTTTFNRRLD